MSKKTAIIMAASLISGSFIAPFAAQAGPEAYLGEIFVMGSNFCPRNSVEAKGQILPISSNSALFSLFGTMYGGDGRTTFALPNLLDGKEKFVNIRYCVVTSGIFPSRP